MRLPLIPREEKFFDLFIDDARNMLGAARLLEQFFRKYDERERLARHARAVALGRVARALPDLDIGADPA